jgi:hypothetical protein
VDEALAELGGFGLFQWLIYLGASIAEMAVTYQIFLLTFITAEPKWLCKNESLICNFSEPMGLTDDDYEARCDMPRSEWKFADDFTSIVTEVGLISMLHCWRLSLLMVQITFTQCTRPGEFGTACTQIRPVSSEIHDLFEISDMRDQSFISHVWARNTC